MTSDCAQFKRAVELIKDGRNEELASVLEYSPLLVRELNDRREEDGFGLSLLHVAAAANNVGAVVMLLERGAPVNIRQLGKPDGQTALHFAASLGFTEVVKRLHEAGAALTAEADGSGGTALTFALFYGHRETARYLAAHAWQPDNLRTAAGLGDDDRVAAFFDDAGRLMPDAGKSRGFQVPHDYFAAMPDSESAGQDVLLGEALHYAARNESLSTLRLLCAKGADINYKAYVEATPLHFCSTWGKRAAVEELLRLGADPLIRDDRYSALPYGWALHGGRRDIADLFFERYPIPPQDLIANGVPEHQPKEIPGSAGGSTDNDSDSAKV